MITYICKQTEAKVFTVGSFRNNKWHPVKDYPDYNSAVEACIRMNKPYCQKQDESGKDESECQS